MRRIVFTLIIALTLTAQLSGIEPVTASGYLIVDETKTINVETFTPWAILTDVTPVTSPVNITITLTILSGGAVDLILFTNDGYAEFLVAFTIPELEFAVVEEGTALDVSDSVTTSTIQDLGAYHAVVENSIAIAGAIPVGPVDIHITITLYDSAQGAGRVLLDALTGEFTFLVFAVIVLAVAISVTYYIVKKQRRKKKWVRKR